jgi:hypothetical protein
MSWYCRWSKDCPSGRGIERLMQWIMHSGAAGRWFETLRVATCSVANASSSDLQFVEARIRLSSACFVHSTGPNIEEFARGCVSLSRCSSLLDSSSPYSKTCAPIQSKAAPTSLSTPFDENLKCPVAASPIALLPNFKC